MSVEDFLSMLVQPVLTGVVVVIVVVVIRRRRAALDNVHGPSTPVGFAKDAASDLVVPVRRLWNTASFWGEHSNISPRLWIAADRLRFKVIRKIQELRFADIREVHVAKLPVVGGMRIFLRRPHWSNMPLSDYGLIVDVSDIGTARTVLRALPQTIPLTEAAARLRDQ